VETVANLLQNQIGVLVNLTSAEVLRLNYDGNLNLSQGDIDGAIKCYDQALRLGDLDQEGVLRVMRGTALLQRAYALRLRHRSLYAIASDLLPLLKDIKTFLFDALSSLPFQTRYTFASTILLRIGKVYDTLDSSSKWNEYKSKWPVIEGPPPVSGKVIYTHFLIVLF
jgi:tetratricopeptide (TPR) repeat protein